jgi:hypothetical protein
MHTSIGRTLMIALVAACARPDHSANEATHARSDGQQVSSKICPPAPGGIIVSFDKVAYFPARGRMSELSKLCAAGRDTLYDAVGWQAEGTQFPFVGATLVALHSGSQPDSISADEPDMWTASGDSIRLPDGQLVPRTLGGLRALGRVMVGKNNETYDDWDGPDARSCRFPEILFKLDGTGLPDSLPDSARVASIEIDVRRRETFKPFCSR